MKLIIVFSFMLIALNINAQDSLYIIDGDTVMVTNESLTSSYSSKIDTVLFTAKKFNGVKYKYAGADYNGMDCSGFVCTAFQSAQIDLPRSSSAISKKGEYIEADHLQTGDLIFFKGRSSTSVGHVAIVSKIKDGAIYIMHSTSSRGVIEEKLEDNSYFLKRWLFNKRIIN